MIPEDDLEKVVICLWVWSKESESKEMSNPVESFLRHISGTETGMSQMR
jgi:hypothetical protein